MILINNNYYLITLFFRGIFRSKKEKYLMIFIRLVTLEIIFKSNF